MYIIYYTGYLHQLTESVNYFNNNNSFITEMPKLYFSSQKQPIYTYYTSRNSHGILQKNVVLKWVNIFPILVCSSYLKAVFFLLTV